MLSIFPCACCPSVYLLWRNVYSKMSFAHFSIGLLTFLLLSCISCLYILDIKPLSVASFEMIFSHSASFLFFFFMVSFAVQKLVSLTRYYWFIFAFISVAFGDWPEILNSFSLSVEISHAFFFFSLLLFYVTVWS